MKKLLTAILATCMLLAMPSAIFADTTDDDTQTYDKSTAEQKKVRLYADVDSTYTVRLPQQVNVKEKSKDFDVDAKGNISSTKKVSVAFDGSASLVDTNTSDKKKESISLTITNNTHDFLFDDLLADDYNDTAKFTVNVAHDDEIPAGTWEVYLPVTISLASIS